MIPAGYMYKRIAQATGMNCKNVNKIYAVAKCISPDFADYISYWKHNKYWFFNTPEAMDGIVLDQKVTDELELLFYEMHEKEFNEKERIWQEIQAEESFGYDVKIPLQQDFLGFDIVTYTFGTSPECSPLSCNLIYREVTVNQYCLLDDLDYAFKIIESLNERKAEPGPYRIIAVNKVRRNA